MSKIEIDKKVLLIYVGILAGCFMFLMFVGMIGIALGPSPSASVNPGNSDEPASVVTTPERIERIPEVKRPAEKAALQQTQAPEITWHEFNAIYGIDSNATDLQREKEWKRFKGKKVSWQGTVVDVSKGVFGGITLQVKMNPDTFTYDLDIKLRKSQKEKASDVRQGSFVRFTGTLDDWGVLLPSTLVDGELE